MKNVIFLLFFLSSFVSSKGQSQIFGLIKPFETYTDTVSVLFLVSELTPSTINHVYSVYGYEVYKHEYHKGEGWKQYGDVMSIDTDEHITTLIKRLDVNKNEFQNIIIWQTRSN